MGTPYYLAPEVIRRVEWNEKVDIWALGVVVFNLCQLNLPFNGNTQKELEY